MLCQNSDEKDRKRSFILEIIINLLLVKVKKKKKPADLVGHTSTISKVDFTSLQKDIFKGFYRKCNTSDFSKKSNKSGPSTE